MLLFMAQVLPWNLITFPLVRATCGTVSLPPVLYKWKDVRLVSTKMNTECCVKAPPVFSANAKRVEHDTSIAKRIRRAAVRVLLFHPN